MTFRCFSSSLLAVFATFCLPGSFHSSVLAQERAASRQRLLQRGDLPSRGRDRLSLSLLRNQVSSSAPIRSTSIRLASAYISPRQDPSSRVFDVRRAVNTHPTLHSPTPIALGAYFYQNGQCAPGDESAVNAWRARAGRLPAVWMIYQGWTGWNQFPIKEARRAQQLGGQLLVTWEPWNGNGRTSGWNCAAIASGGQDVHIRQYARAVKAAGAPVMIRFAHEMNGDWYPWSTAFNSPTRRHNGNTPVSYVAMWRRVVALFRAEGAHNVQWVWAPNIQYVNQFNSERDQYADLAALYPGDDAVDWIGISVYNDTSKQNWRTFSDLFEGTYRALTRISGKPLMIAEMGATEMGAPYGTSKAAWISQTLMRDIPVRFPRVKLVNWFCRDKSALGEANYRFDSSPGALQAFRVAVNSPLYGARINGK